uniref:Uncharacterized protein n=1 Tax=viral metagenome TaxID=1070528 RepID=A0A6M3LMG6_9ZZZZ
MHKYELATHKTTEVMAVNAITNDTVTVWLNKVREAGKYVDGDGVNSSIERVAKILVELINEIKAGKVDREVISELAKKQNITASLVIAQHRLERKR